MNLKTLENYTNRIKTSNKGFNMIDDLMLMFDVAKLSLDKKQDLKTELNTKGIDYNFLDLCMIN